MGCYNGSELQDSGCSSQSLSQPLWDTIRTREAFTRSPIFPVTFSIITYVGFCLPFVVSDVSYPWVPISRRYKIHPDFSPSVKQLSPCSGSTLYQHSVFVFPVTSSHWVRSPALLPQEAPELVQLLSHVSICSSLFDTEIFAWHSSHHKVPWSYRTFHKVHHQNSSSFASATQYMSFWESLSSTFFDVSNVAVLRCHPLTIFTFHVINIWSSVEDHSGYDFPWSTHRLVPFGWYGGVAHHDMHHSQFNCNFAPYFTHWDKMSGTSRSAPSPESLCACGERCVNSRERCAVHLIQKKKQT